MKPRASVPSAQAHSPKIFLPLACAREKTGTVEALDSFVNIGRLHVLWPDTDTDQARANAAWQPRAFHQPQGHGNRVGSGDRGYAPVVSASTPAGAA